ncbi:Autophagy-related protein 9 [Cladobotryum mycophilum]|uniref:Autophagy-related protein 9 n=1 Tax=Cladobotryum mycophilum TaxID=491253 RepID=A0ABR0SUI2_9HYPO
MTSKVFGRLTASSRDTRSFYEELRTRDDDHVDEEAGLNLDEDNLRQHFHELDPESLVAGDSRITVDSAIYGGRSQVERVPRHPDGRHEAAPRWQHLDDDADNDVPESLLVEANGAVPLLNATTGRAARKNRLQTGSARGAPSTQARGQWDNTAAHPQPPEAVSRGHTSTAQPRSIMSGTITGGRREKALWRWVNTTNLDSFMRDVYDYYEGGGIWCILCSNALWLLETLFVAVLLTFLSQCVDYRKIPHSRSLGEVVISQCTKKMSGLWNFGIWLYTFFFIWKSVQYFFEIRRLVHIREFFVYLLEIPEQDMQTVSWQDVVARIMALRDQNPKTASNISPSLRRYMGSQSKERLDAHDIANRLMRKENYLIAMINKDLLNLSLPLPFLRDKQLFSKTMEWYLHYCILDMAFNELGQVQQDFLRADRRGLLSQKLKQRFYFAGILNLIFAPIVLAYVVIVYFFTYYNEYQKDPKLAAARKYTSLTEWKFREFNELPHIFYERIHMSFPFATRYIDQFPKRMTEEIARSVAFISGAITAILAVGTLLDSELFLGFEITEDRTVLFYLGVFGGIWAISRGMVSEESAVFNPEYALRNVVEYTHYMPDHWQGKLHSFEVKQEFAELYKMKVVIFLEEVMGILTTPMLLLLSLPKCSDQIVDFFREFTVHVDGLGYVCSFAVFDFKKGPEHAGRQGPNQDVREDYYATKHGKMAASYYGFIDNYVINPKTGIPGHMPPGMQHQFHPPPAFPSLNSPTLAADVQNSQIRGAEMGRARSRTIGSSGVLRGGHPITLPSPMASMLLDPHHQPTPASFGTKSLHKSRHRRGTHRAEGLIPEETYDEGTVHKGLEEDVTESGGILGESTWETSPGKGLSRENSASNTEEPEAGVLGLIYQLRQTQHHRRGGMI